MKHVLLVADQCTGCMSCMNSCPKKAIYETKDDWGFYYPAIDETLCIDCGKCTTVCPVLKKNQNATDQRQKAYYGSVLASEIVKESSSGGAFSFMADYVLGRGGLVCGAMFDYDCMEVVYSTTDSCSLDALRKSKYVASAPRYIFEKIKVELNKGRLVLFCGLPCHVDGLKSFCAKDYENLIVCDFICGGVASPRFFKEHISKLEKKYKSKASNVNFRAKINGWQEHSIKVEFSNGKKYTRIATYDSFFQGYFEKRYQRDSCYQCKYRLCHESDIIIADYWGGIPKGRANNAGTSMIITNSKKGNEFFSNVLNAGNHAFHEMPVSDSDYVIKTESERYGKAYKTKRPFMELYQKYGFEKAVSKSYFKGLWKQKLKRQIYKLYKSIKKK